LVVCQRLFAQLSSRAGHGDNLGKFLDSFPLHKNLHFHKFLAVSVFVFGFVHAFCHFMAHSYVLPTFTRFGQDGKAITISIWVTGAIMVIVIGVMYPVSRAYVRRTYFELFVWTHYICAVIFIVCTYWHAPMFFWWGTIPIVLYIVDAYTRSMVASSVTLKLLEVKWRPPVLQLTFDKPFKYLAGQYVWLNCPSLGKHEYHPFTISSAPETGLLCLAIKCWPGGWTERLRDMISLVCESSTGRQVDFTFAFEEVDWLTGETRRGVSEFANGQPLMYINGPHSTPAVHYPEFEVAILACAGFGLPPASSIIRSLVQYRWRSEEALPRHIYFCWLCSLAEVPAYEWFAEELSEVEVAASVNAKRHEEAGLPPQTCEFHIFVTRALVAEDDAWKPPRPRPAKCYGQIAKEYENVNRPYSGAELLDWMRHPAVKSSDMAGVYGMDVRPNKAGNTQVWNGRPDWSALFSHVASQHAHEGSARLQVGVFFCGAPDLGKDLTPNCHKHSSEKVQFRLMKESV